MGIFGESKLCDILNANNHKIKGLSLYLFYYNMTINPMGILGGNNPLYMIIGVFFKIVKSWGRFNREDKKRKYGY